MDDRNTAHQLNHNGTTSTTKIQVPLLKYFYTFVVSVVSSWFLLYLV